MLWSGMRSDSNEKMTLLDNIKIRLRSSRMNCKGLEGLVFANLKGLEGWSLAKTATCRITSQSTHQARTCLCPFSFQHLLILKSPSERVAYWAFLGNISSF